MLMNHPLWIASAVEEAATGTDEVSQNISNVTKVAGETGNEAEKLHGTASSLPAQSDVLSSEVNNFLEQIKNLDKDADAA